MICRVAGSCFWMHRYVERAENTARLLEVTRTLALGLEVTDPWEGPLVASDERRRFVRRHSAEAVRDGEAVQEFLTWDEDNPVSIINSVRMARENARVAREIISEEMWEALNGFWHWISGRDGRRDYDREPDAFYLRIRESLSLFQGACHDSMLHEEPFDFMRLGLLLERCGQTARILDARHHGPGGRATPTDSARSLALLKSCSATQPFFRLHHGDVTAAAVADFLVGEIRFPRSILHCLDRAWNFLERLRPRKRSRLGVRSAKCLEMLLHAVRRRRRAVAPGEVRAECRLVIDSTDTVCDAIEADFFHPSQAGLRQVLEAGRS